MAAVTTAIAAVSALAMGAMSYESSRQQKDAANESAKRQKLEQERLLAEEKARTDKEEKDRQRQAMNQYGRQRSTESAAASGGRRSTILTGPGSTLGGTNSPASAGGSKTLLGM